MSNGWLAAAGLVKWAGMRKLIACCVLGLCVFAVYARSPEPSQQERGAATPIRHLIIIFPENISFDHYFGTYPHAENAPNEPKFVALADTPTVNGLTPALLQHNANSLNPDNGPGAVNPFRLDRTQAATADQQHAYRPEQMAFHGGLMDLFPKSVGKGNAPQGSSTSPLNTTGLTMGYFDGNTVTALWNYAQHFSMSDNSYGSNFGPSTPGAINLVSGQTNGVTDLRNGRGGVADGGDGSFTLISDPDPVGDVCSATTRMLVSMAGNNIGDVTERSECQLGMVQRRLRSYETKHERHNGM